jgi:hypothetical protein
MAKVKFGAVVTDMRNKVGSQVFSKNRYGAYTRSFKAHLTSATPAQAVTKARLVNFSQAWRGLTEAQRLAWNNAVQSFLSTDVFGSKQRPSGFDLYVKLNCNLDQIGVAPLLYPPIPGSTQTPDLFTINLLTAVNTLIVDSSPSAVPAGFEYVLMASKPLSPGITYAKNLVRQIAVLDEGTAFPYDASTAYNAKFGPIPFDCRIACQIITVNKVTGQKSFPVNAHGILPYIDPDVVILYAAMTVKCSFAELLAINQMVIDLKAAGIWAKLDWLHVYAQQTSQASLLNWKSPGTFDGTIVNGVAFTSDRGQQGNGSDGYIHTGFVPASNGVNYTRDKAAAGVYINGNAAPANAVDIGTNDVSNHEMYINACYADGNTYGKINDNSNKSCAAPGGSALGFTSMVRPSSSVSQIWVNGVMLENSAATSLGLSIQSLDVMILQNGAGGFGQSPRRIALAYAGSSDINQATFYSIIQTYMVNRGAQW